MKRLQLTFMVIVVSWAAGKLLYAYFYGFWVATGLAAHYSR